MATRAKLVFIDTETTDLSPRTGAIWEVGMVVRGPEHETDLPVLMQVITDPAGADPGALSVGRFRERYGRDTTPVEEEKVAYAVQAYTAGRYLVGANPAYDQKFLEDLLHRHGLKPGWHHRLIDVEVLAAGCYCLPVPMGLRQTAEFMGVEFDPEELHTAFGDADLARRIYDQIIHGLLPDNGR